jgi:hypothetical protein
MEDLGVGLLGYKTLRASWIPTAAGKKFGLQSLFPRVFGVNLRGFSAWELSPNLNRRRQTYYRLPMALHCRPVL